MHTPFASCEVEPLRVLIARPERRRLPLPESSTSPVVVRTVRDGWDVLAALGAGRFDLVVLDLEPFDLDPMTLIAMVRAAGLTTPFRVVVDAIERPLRLEAVRLGRVSLVVRPAARAVAEVRSQPAPLRLVAAG